NELTSARTAADRAMALVQQSGDRMVRIQAGFARAEVDILSGNSSSAQRSLKALHAQAFSSGYATLDLKARLLLSQAELQSGKQAEARAHLAELREDARRKGFRLIARQASANDEANGG